MERAGLWLALALVAGLTALLPAGAALADSCPGSFTAQCPYDGVVSVGSGTGGQLRSPDGVAIGPDGAIYVTDESADNGSLAQLDAFDANGNFVRRLVPGANDLYRFQPSRVAVAPSGDVYALDRSASQVWHFDSAGRYIGSFDVGGSNCCIATAPDGSVWIIDSTDSLIEHYDATGTKLSSFATPANVNYDAIAISPDGHVMLGRGNAVEEYNASGTLLAEHGIDVDRGLALDSNGQTLITTFGGDVNSVGRDGTGASSFAVAGASGLGGVAVDKTGSLVVADPDQHQLDFFSPQGTLIKSVGQPAPASLFAPSSASTTSGGDFVVADTQNHRLARFDAAGHYLGRADDGSLGATYWPTSGAWDPTAGVNVTNDLSGLDEFGPDGSLSTHLSPGQGSYGEVAVDSKGDIYAIVSSQPSQRGTIAEYASDGRLLRVLSGDRIANPISIAIGPADSLYVFQGWYYDQATGASVHPTLDVYGPDGGYLRTYPQLSCQPEVESIAVDQQGRVFLGEIYYVTIYDEDENLLGGFGKAAGEFSDTSLSIDGNDVLSVTDRWRNRVTRFHINSAALRPIPPTSTCGFAEPTVTTSSTSLSVRRNGLTSVSVRCNGHLGTECDGNASLLLRIVRRRLRGAAAWPVADTGFKIAAGDTERVRLRLNPAARKLLRRKRRLRGSVMLEVAGHAPVSQRVVIHRHGLG